MDVLFYGPRDRICCYFDNSGSLYRVSARHDINGQSYLHNHNNFIRVD